MVDWEGFVRVWTSSQTMKEASNRLGLNPRAVIGRASYLRKKGVNLKKFTTRVGGFSAETLNRIISETEKAIGATDANK